jgi:hypothetical protein
MGNLSIKEKNKEDITMEKEVNMMEQFDFLLGNWNLESKIPKSKHSEAMTGTGSGTLSRKLSEKYVIFDYSAFIGEELEEQAHAVFAWDSKIKNYRFWWFECSGNFMTATCNFINNETLLLNWHNSLLIQTFQKIESDKVILKMEEPNAEGKYIPILEVIFTRK